MTVSHTEISVDLPIKMAAVLVQMCPSTTLDLSSWFPALLVLPAPGFIMLSSTLGHIQVLCGSCAGAYSIGRSVAFWQRALLHLWVLCVIPSRRSLLYTSLLVQVSHSFLLEICFVNFSIGTWTSRISTDSEEYSRGILAQQEVCYPFHLVSECLM